MSIELESYTVAIGGGMQLGLKMNGTSYTAYGTLSELTDLIVNLKKVRLAMIMQVDKEITEKAESAIVEQEKKIRSILLEPKGQEEEIPF